MRVVTDDHPEPFLARARTFLESDPFSTNVITTVTTRMASGALPRVDGARWFTVAAADGQTIGIAMHTPPHNAFLSRMPDEAIDPLVQELARQDRRLPGVNGAKESTRAFALAWEARTGRASGSPGPRGCIA